MTNPYCAQQINNICQNCIYCTINHWQHLSMMMIDFGAGLGFLLPTIGWWFATSVIHTHHEINTRYILRIYESVQVCSVSIYSRILQVLKARAAS